MTTRAIVRPVVRPIARPIAGGITSPIIGPEMLLNGGFDTDTVWTKGLSWVIAAGVATVTTPASLSALVQAVSPVVNATYRVTFTISGYVGGAASIRFRNAGANVITFTSAIADGTYTADAVLPSAADEFAIVAPNALASYSVDNVSLKRVFV